MHLFPKRIYHHLLLWALLPIILFCFLTPVFPQNDNDTCLGCHEDPDLVREREGMEGTSVYVNPKAYNASVHKEIFCIDCHLDADVEDFPHEDILEPVNCPLCHSDINTDFHFATDKVYKEKRIPENLQKTNKCVFCHGKHDILPGSDEDSTINRFNVPYTCGQCHGSDEEGIKSKYVPPEFKSEKYKTLSDYKRGAHGWALFKSGLIVSAVCSDCHNPHDQHIKLDDKRISVQVCTKCHVGVSKDYMRSIHATAKSNTRKMQPCGRPATPITKY